MKIKSNLGLLLVVLLLATGCSGPWETEGDALALEIEAQKEAMQALEQKVDELSLQNEALLELLAEKTPYDDLLELTSYEQLISEQFKEAYDDSVLAGLGPLSICRMYINAGFFRDYGTQYELLAQKGNPVPMTKEEFLSSSDKAEDYSVFQDVYNLGVAFVAMDAQGNPGGATISWKSENGYTDETQGAFLYSFMLLKEDSVWKVCFLPMQ